MAPLDRALLLTLGPVWLLCAALAVSQSPIAWPGVVVSGPASRDGYPVVAGFWKGLGAEASGLLPGDELTRVGVAPLAGVGAIGFLARVLEERGTDRVVSVVYRRAGVRGEARLGLAPFPIPFWLYLLVPLTFATTGVVVALRAPRAGEGRCVFHAYAACAFYFLPWPGGPRLQTYAWLVVTAIGALVVLPLSLRSFLLFPREVAPTRAWVHAAPWGFALLAPSLASWWLGIPLSHDAGFRAVRALSVAFIVAMLAVALVGYRRAHPVARRKMRWRLYGVSIGMAPAFAVETLGLVYPDLPYFSTLHIASILGLIAFPVALTIAILRYNALDIDRLISATASYSIVCVLALGAAFVLIPRLTVVLSGALGTERAINHAALSLALAALVVPAHRRLRPQIDRIFFAKRFAAERGLERLLDELSACSDARTLLLLAASRLQEVLEPASMVLYAGPGDGYEPVFVRGLAPRRFDRNGALMAALERLDRPLASGCAPTGWTGGDPGPFDRATLEALGASVIVPIRSDRRLAAVLSFGTKRSGDVYTTTDLSWLAVVADKVSGELLRLEYARRLAEQEMRQQRLRRYVPAAVAKQLDRGAELETGEREVSVLFVDLRGHTAFAESRRSAEVFSTVNRYMEAVTRLLDRHGGSVVEFAGDGAMAVFGAPEALVAKERAALDAGYEIVSAVGSLAPTGAQPLRAGVGIATGAACVGNVRGSDRLIWTVLGDTPNLAARLQGLTRELDADIVVDGVTWSRGGSAAAAFEHRPGTRVRGRSAPADVYLLRVLSR